VAAAAAATIRTTLIFRRTSWRCQSSSSVDKAEFRSSKAVLAALSASGLVDRQAPAVRDQTRLSGGSDPPPPAVHACSLFRYVLGVCMKLVLRPTRLHWLDEPLGDPADLCVHSPVQVEVDGVALIRPEDGDWTVSAASLYLLRTLTHTHNATSRVGDCGQVLDILFLRSGFLTSTV